ncbi:MAG: hypothetical protein JW864_05040 [Spirochaetes bacterium]|nr:hypothetical protein [Spirochaetota bacterium]
MFKIKQIIKVPGKAVFIRAFLMALLFAFMVLYFFVSNKIIWILYLLYLGLILLSRMKLMLKPELITILVLLPLLWGFFMSLNSDFYHFVQGFFYLSIPVILIITGFQISKIFTAEQYFSYLLKIGNLVALLFIVLTIFRAGFGAFISPYTESRFVVASGAPVCIMSLLIAAYSEHFDLKILKTSRVRYLTILLNLIAIYLFASRTYWVILFLFIFFFSIKTMKKDKLIFYGFLVIGCLLLMTAVINSRTGLTFQNSFLYKLVWSFTEIRVGNLSNYEDINTYYRGYEAYKSWITFTEGTFLQKIFGGGYGKLVSLDTEVLLDGKYWSEVPWVHNGFFFILVKQGVLGIIFVLLFFWRIAKTGMKGFNDLNPLKQFSGLFLLGCAASMFTANYVVCALFSHEMAILIITTGFLSGAILHDT